MNANPKDSPQHVVGTPAEPPQSSGAEQRSHAPPAALHGRLLQVSRMATIGEMAAGVAHELNQPLTAIANYAQACSRLLSRPGTDPSELQQALAEITAEAARAAVGNVTIAEHHIAIQDPHARRIGFGECRGIVDSAIRT